MIEAKVENLQEASEASANEHTPEVITTSQIIEDLENGIDRKGIAEKYNLKDSEVKIMFQHPALKGKRVKKNKVTTLRFKLVDDTESTSTEIKDENQTSLLDEIKEVKDSYLDGRSENENTNPENDLI